jgi:quercetin dioxygenase-like cupin family protein
MSDPIPCDNLDEAIDRYTTQFGYRLDMIVPADSPYEAVLSKDGEKLLLKLQPSATADGTAGKTRSSQWITGRAGMEYRDLIPDRLGGRLIASHIRLTSGGEVPDYVHYHKVEFQMIYCKRGRIRVVYEDQGEPFWLETGDCVLQPPEIRHRVLECTAGAEVIELGMPAVHETWVEHEITLPTAAIRRDRFFNGQQFVRHIAADAEWNQSEFDGVEYRDTGIFEVTNGFADVRVLRLAEASGLIAKNAKRPEIAFYFLLNGPVKITTAERAAKEFVTGDAFVAQFDSKGVISCPAGTELLQATLEPRDL